MDSLAQPVAGEFPKGSGKRRLGRNIADHHKTADTSEVCRTMQGLDDGPGSGVATMKLIFSKI
jgi:hypothetical protein